MFASKAKIVCINEGRRQGPISIDKARASRNARTQGQSGTVLGHESQAEFDALARAYSQRFQPANAVERDLVDEIVSSRWRLRRVEMMEVALINRAVEKQMEELGPGADACLARARAFTNLAEKPNGLQMLERFARRLRRTYEQAQQNLSALQRNRSDHEPEPEPAPSYSALRKKMPRPNGFLKVVSPCAERQNAAPLETRWAA